MVCYCRSSSSSSRGISSYHSQSKSDTHSIKKFSRELNLLSSMLFKFLNWQERLSALIAVIFFIFFWFSLQIGLARLFQWQLLFNVSLTPNK